MKQLSSLILLLLLCKIGQSQDLNQSLDKLIRAWEQSNNVLGFVSIDSGKSFTYNKSFGSVPGSRNTPVDSNSLFALGSLTKTYTACLVLKLVDEGKIKLTDPLSKYNRELPYADEISIKGLLTHSSGLDDRRVAKWRYMNAELELLEKPRYSNFGYGYLGLVIEAIEGKRLDSVFQEKLAEPRGLSATVFDYSDTTAEALVPAYYKQKKQWLQRPDVKAGRKDAGGAGAALGTARDMNRFLKLLFQDSIITEEMLAQMCSIEHGFGMGLFRAHFYGMKGYTNSGQIGQYRSTFVAFPEENIYITITTNAMVGKGRNAVSLNNMLKEIMQVLTKQ